MIHMEADNFHSHIITLSFGVDGMEPITGTEDELLSLLDNYPLSVIEEVFWSEAALKSDAYPVLRRYFAKRAVSYLVRGK